MQPIFPQQPGLLFYDHPRTNPIGFHAIASTLAASLDISELMKVQIRVDQGHSVSPESFTILNTLSPRALRRAISANRQAQKRRRRLLSRIGLQARSGKQLLCRGQKLKLGRYRFRLC